MHFEFATATRILFGAGAVREAPAEVAARGRRPLVVTGRSAARAQGLLDALTKEDVETPVLFSVGGEPAIEEVEQGLAAAREAGCDVVVGFGGGSALDAGKAIAALLTNGGAPLDYLEGIGRGRPLTVRSAPYIAVPTTAGTGAEVTKNAVLRSRKERVKVSMRSPLMLPALAVVDPRLTDDLPPELTASTGLDALTQLLEAFVCRKANPVTDALCREGLPRAARALPAAYHDGRDAVARDDMALAALLGGMVLANAGLGAVHGFAGPLGGLFPAPHGAVCARLLPFVVAANVKALSARGEDAAVRARFDEAAALLTGRADTKAADGVAWLHDLCGALRVPPLATYGLTEAAFPAVIEKAGKASSMKGNPVELSGDELMEVLRDAC